MLTSKKKSSTRKKKTANSTESYRIILNFPLEFINFIHLIKCTFSSLFGGILGEKNFAWNEKLNARKERQSTTHEQKKNIFVKATKKKRKRKNL